MSLTTNYRRITSTLILLVLTGMLLSSPIDAAQPKYRLKSAYIYNFLKYIHWQDEAQIKHWRIAIIVDNKVTSSQSTQQITSEQKLINELITASQHQIVRNNLVSVEQFTNITNIPSLKLSEFHLIFITNSAKKKLKEIAQFTRQTQTLIVTENSNDRTSFMVNLLADQQDHISFEVNKSNIIFEGLRMNKDMLLLGGTELDVAQLLRETEDSMFSAQQAKKEQEQQLLLLHKKIASQSLLLTQQKEQFNTVSLELSNNQKKLLAEKSKLEKLTLSKQKIQQTLANNLTDLTNNEQELLRKQQRLKQQEDLIKVKENEVNKLSEKINFNKKNVDTIVSDLLSLQAQLTKKQSDINMLDGQVSRQRLYLWTFSIGAILFSILLYVIWRLATSRQEANTALAQNNSRLKLAQQQVVKAKVSAEAANKAKSEFISSMSHELRTPLNAVIGYSQLLQMGEMSKEEISQGSEEILTAGKHLLDLINDILDLAHIESNKFDVHLKSIDVNHVLDNCTLLIKNFAKTANIKIHRKENAKENSFVIADSVRLKQVILNLLSNAIKYNNKNGQVFLSTSVVEDKYIQIEVTDTGIGLSEKQLNMLFQPFNRLGVENSNIQGTGIGLVITKQLIEKMNGTITVTSSVGKGSTFIVKFLLADPIEINSNNNITLTKNINTAENTLSVLYVEDNLSNQRVIKAMLTKDNNIDVRLAISAENALKVIEQHKPQIILLDIDLPGMNGYELFNILRANDNYKNIPIIAITAKAMSTDLTKADAYNFSSYLTKPVLLNDLNQAITKATNE